MAHSDDTTTPSGTTPDTTTTPNGTNSKVTEEDLLRAWGLRRGKDGTLVFATKKDEEAQDEEAQDEEAQDEEELTDDEWLNAHEGAIKGAAKRMHLAARARGFEGVVDPDDCEAQLRSALINMRHWAAGKEGAVGTKETFGQCPSSLPGRWLQSSDRINRTLGPLIGVPANQLSKPRTKDKNGKEQPKDKGSNEEPKDEEEGQARPFVRQVPLTPRDDDALHADPLPPSASAEAECLDYMDKKEGWRSPRQIAADIVARWQAQSRYKQAKRLDDWVTANPDKCWGVITPQDWSKLDASWRRRITERLGGPANRPSRLTD